MPRPSILSLLILAVWAMPTLAADGDGELNGVIEVPTLPTNSNTTDPLLPPAETITDEEAPPAHPQVPLPKPDPRFTTKKEEDRPRFRRWLTHLCREDAVAEEISERVHYTKDKPRTIFRAQNKVGTLLLLLENYAELAKFRIDCIAERKTNPGACIRNGRLPKPWDVKETSGPNAWLNFGSRKFQSDAQLNRTPSGIAAKTDLLRASAEQVNDIEAALKKEFFELRDLSSLGGEKDPAEAARKLADAVRGESTCRTRAVSAGPEKQRSPAQK